MIASGVEVPAVRPTSEQSTNHSGRSSSAPATRYAGRPRPRGQFDELSAIIALWTADDDYHVRLGGEVAQRLLAILGRLAHGIDEVKVRVREAPPHRRDQLMHALQRLRRLRYHAQPQVRLALDALGELVQVRLVLDDGAVVEIADEAAHLDVPGLADDNGMSSLGRETSEGTVSARHQRTGGVVDGEAALAQFQTHAVGDAVGRQQHRRRVDVLLTIDAHGAGGVELGDHVGIVDEIAEDGQRSLARQADGEIDGVAHAEAHTEVLSQLYLHNGLPFLGETAG